jgi:anti-sigma regulatory factor (Ser/Thr protein kinase)
VEEIFGGPLPQPPDDHQSSRFTGDDLVTVRRRVSDHAARHGIDEERAADLELAVTELATNSLRHAGGEGVLRTWREGDALVVEVADGGRIVDPLVGRRPPGPDDEGGRGVWMANQLCDLVQVRSSSVGTVVRLVMWLERQAA